MIFYTQYYRHRSDGGGYYPRGGGYRGGRGGYEHHRGRGGFRRDRSPRDRSPRRSSHDHGAGRKSSPISRRRDSPEDRRRRLSPSPAKNGVGSAERTKGSRRRSSPGGGSLSPLSRSPSADGGRQPQKRMQSPQVKIDDTIFRQNRDRDGAGDDGDSPQVGAPCDGAFRIRNI